MLSEKEIKQNFKEKIQKDPEKYFPVKTLKNLDFKRYKCNNCPNYFWSIEKNDYCGDPLCSGGFRFINKPVTKNKLDYLKVWEKFSKIHKDLGYTPIKRYPSVARWNPTTDFTIASIAAFQPFVVSGEIEPPANPLVIPQFCLRFNDVDNVGLTGHFTGFSMMGQHAFVKPEKYDINKYLKDHLTWLNKGLGLKNKDLVIHEDAWIGGGNLGNSLEFFSEGLEISNQVYMQYEINNEKINELKIKVLDMGQGQERAAWFTQGTSSSYEATFPEVIKYLKQQTGIKTNEDLMKKFLPYSSYLNVDEVKNIDSMWKKISQNLKVKENELRNEILPSAALYSIAEHARTLLFAITDSALPSNVAGGYNLRTIFRRAESFMEKYYWNIDWNKLIELHANYLKPLFPELRENLEDVEKILKNEKSKYQSTKQKSNQIIVNLMEKEITEKDLLTLYDSYGITPETIKEEAIKLKKEIKIPPNFYALISALHEKKEQKYQTVKEETLDLNNLPETELLFYNDEKAVNFEAKILKVIDNKVVLDKTLFYGTSGGQLHDTGYLERYEVIDVFRQKNITVHVLRENPEFKINDTIKGKIDWNRRYQLMQHHTTTHIVNAGAKIVLGNHVNQAGAFKDVQKARIDITHYQPVSEAELKKIEEESNRIVNKKIKIEKSFMPKSEAEKKYGMLIYQGGVPIGKNLRIVNILNTDVEACGGTHLDNTSEAGLIKILKSNKISDNIVRIEFKSGKAAEAELNLENDILDRVSKLLNCTKEQVPGRAEELFMKWKKVIKKKSFTKDDFILTSNKKEEGSDEKLLKKTAEILKTQPEFIPKTIKRFLDEIKNNL
ncbi:alanine--tRNA ligase [Candidatus Woesearchaeota archaeon]|nr:alanine--tRNA ligase [Candidatus Woesearchaeota archaeon]